MEQLKTYVNHKENDKIGDTSIDDELDDLAIYHYLFYMREKGEKSKEINQKKKKKPNKLHYSVFVYAQKHRIYDQKKTQYLQFFFT